MSDDVAGVNDDLKAEVTLPRAPFRTRLLEWTPGEEASWLLGHALGLFPGFEKFALFRDKVGNSWTRSAKSTALFDCLENLRVAGLVERQQGDHDYEYRWVAKRWPGGY